MALENEKVYIFAEKAYYALLGVCIFIAALFSYMSWYFYNVMQGTSAQKFTIIIALPILIAIILLSMLLLTGKKAAANEIAEFLKKS